MLRREDEEIDDLLAAPVYERGGLTVIHIVQAPANHGKSFGTEILDSRGKIESAIKSGLDRVLVRREHVGQMILCQRTQVVVNDFSGS